MIIQAKSGTGKTCVFAVVSLEMVNVQLNQVQVVILAPTREIAIQICDNINCIGVDYPGLKCFAFIGGIALEQDKVSDVYVRVNANCALFKYCIAVSTKHLTLLIVKKVDT